MYTCTAITHHENSRFGNVLNMLLLALFFFLAMPAAGSMACGASQPFSGEKPHEVFLASIQLSDFDVLPKRSLSFLPAESETTPLQGTNAQSPEDATLDIAEDWSFPISALTGNRTSFPPESIHGNTNSSGKVLRATKTGEKRFHASGSTFCIHPDGIVLPQRSIRPLVGIPTTPRCLLPAARGLVVFSLPPPHSC